MQNYSLMFLSYVVMAALRPATTTLINEVFSDYNEMPSSIINQGMGYHYDPPYITYSIKGLQQQQQQQQQQEEEEQEQQQQQQHQHQNQQFNGLLSYGRDECSLSYHAIQDHHYLYPVSNSYTKSPLIYLYMLKRFDGKPKPTENVAFTTVLQMPYKLASRSSNIKAPPSVITIHSTPTTIGATTHQVKPAATIATATATTTFAALKGHPLEQSSSSSSSSSLSSSPSTSKSKIKYTTRKYVNLKLPLRYDKLPLNVPQLPLQGGAPYASLPKGVTSYDLPPHPLR